MTFGIGSRTVGLFREMHMKFARRALATNTFAPAAIISTMRRRPVPRFNQAV